MYFLIGVPGETSEDLKKQESSHEEKLPADIKRAL